MDVYKIIFCYKFETDCSQEHDSKLSQLPYFDSSLADVYTYFMFQDGTEMSCSLNHLRDSGFPIPQHLKPPSYKWFSFIKYRSVESDLGNFHKIFLLVNRHYELTFFFQCVFENTAIVKQFT